MAEINANIIVEPYDITVVTENNNINVAVEPINLNVVSGGYAQPEGNAGQIQYNLDGQSFAGAANTDCSNGNVSFTNIANLKIAGGNTGYYLQTDGGGTLTWAAGTANVTGSGTAAGSNNQIQLSDGTGNFKVGAGFNFDPASNILTVPGLVSAPNANFTSNVNAGNFIGNFIGNITFAANANYANYAGTVLTNAQPNITSVGNLTDLRIQNSRLHLGTNSGNSGQENSSIAIGEEAGPANLRLGAIAIGAFSADSGMSNYSIAIGYDADGAAGGGNTIGIGYNAIGGNHGISLGTNTRTSTHSIAIGSYANASSANTIVINATGANLTGSTANALFIKPIRNATQSNVLVYDQSTGEVTYSTPTAGSQISNGTSNVSVISSGNVTVSVAGVSNVAVFTSTGLRIPGNITAPQIISNVATGTAPFVVTSTTTVANLTTAFANYAYFSGNASIANTANALVAQNVISANYLFQTNVANRGFIALPSAGSSLGYRTIINDGNLTPINNFGQIVGGGGSNVVPVYSDGSNWRIG